MATKEDIVEPHHKQQEFCLNRPKYRQGRKLTSVKVFTINDESKYLLVVNIPSIDIEKELMVLCQKFGNLEDFRLLKEYPCEKFTVTYLVKYKFLRNARYAKKQLDGKSFFGEILHVCYCPEYETIDDVREKITEREKSVNYFSGDNPKKKKHFSSVSKYSNMSSSTSNQSLLNSDKIKRGNLFKTNKLLTLSKDIKTKSEFSEHEIKNIEYSKDNTNEMNELENNVISKDTSSNPKKKIKLFGNNKNVLVYKSDEVV